MEPSRNSIQVPAGILVDTNIHLLPNKSTMIYKNKYWYTELRHELCWILIILHSKIIYSDDVNRLKITCLLTIILICFQCFPYWRVRTHTFKGGNFRGISAFGNTFQLIRNIWKDYEISRGVPIGISAFICIVWFPTSYVSNKGKELQTIICIDLAVFI